MIKIKLGNIFEKRFKHSLLQQEDVDPSSLTNPTDVALYKRLTDQDKQLPGIQRLLELGYIPIVSAKQKSSQLVHTPELGRGVQGIVYEVVKNGNKYAAKVSRGNEPAGDRQEFEVTQRLEKLKDRLPHNISRHFKMIYHMEYFKEEDEEDIRRQKKCLSLCYGTIRTFGSI